MGRGKTVYLTYTALVLLSAVSGASAGLWTVDIDESPAPAPDQGPPFSANATRNPKLIPFQVIGILGAYIGSCLIVGSLLLTLGRRLRKRAQNMASQPKEMIKPLHKTFDRSPVPVSPESGKAWYSPRRLREKKSATSSIRSVRSNHASPGMDSVASFDNHVIEADRARRQEEMERLYAAVMAQDERKSGQQHVTATEVLPDGTTPPEYFDRGPQSPRSPVRAIYPPGSSIPAGPTSPTSPIRADYPTFHKRTPSSSSNQTTTSTVASTTNPKKIRKSLRNIKISSPIMRGGDDNSDGARTPLSPRYYVNPGIPPEPPTARTTDTNNTQPTTPGTARTWDGQYAEDDNVHGEAMDEVRDLPLANPQRTGGGGAVADLAKPAGTATGTGALPLREMNRQAAQAYHAQVQAQAAFPLSPSNWNRIDATSPGQPSPYMTSAGPIKTTFLEARRDKFGGPPRTGLATPYSPYMPYTPVTPVTPHLTGRAERKQREREARRARGAIMEEDAVEEEGEMFGSAY